MEDNTNTQDDASILMDQLNLLTMQSFPESNPHPEMMVLDDGTVLYSNSPARVAFAQQYTGKTWNIPQAWMPYLERALQSDQCTMPIQDGDKTYDLWIVKIDNICVNIYAYDVTERDQALKKLQHQQEHLIALRTHELATANQYLQTENKRYQALQSELEKIVMKDDLTELANRRCFNQAINQAFLRCRRAKTILAVMFIDLNGFKQVNDRYGHDVGDLLLCEVANRLRNSLRDLDMPARIGGDEFAVLVEGFSQPYDIHLPAQRIVHALAKPFCLAKHDITISASLGISIFPGVADSVETLLKQSDLAMYQAKAAGGGYHFYHAENSAAVMEVNA